MGGGEREGWREGREGRREGREEGRGEGRREAERKDGKRGIGGGRDIAITRINAALESTPPPPACLKLINAAL